MKRILIFIGLVFLSLVFSTKVQASEAALGIHLLDPNELGQALDLVEGSEENHGAVTVVLRTDDRDSEKWQNFFDICKEKHVVPIIRLATQMSEDGWRKPTKKDIVEHAAFLSSLKWPTDELLIVAFNEPNHAGEWGGEVDPEEYGQVLEFTINWFKTEEKNYQVLPAGLDATAPNSAKSLDSFVFLQRMLNGNPEIVSRIDAWVAHAYPNPGFVSSPRASGKTSIRSFETELEFLSRYTDRDFDVYITETGWKKTEKTAEKIADYYKYALTEVWKDERIKAITPFVFAAHNGAFKDFSFTNEDGSPTPQYLVLKEFKEIPQEIPPQQFLAWLKNNMD